MKQVFNGMTLKTFMAFSFAMMVHTILLAQDGGNTGTGSAEKTTSVTRTETTTSEWYTSPWVWVIGIAVFVLLLVALLRGNGSDRTVAAGRTDKVTVTKTTSSDIV